ncbi:MAG: hypothetical protein JW807_14080 [Spirochaetes bacterium]|nr:hypothetical protein [Spirochaetota bacterium]
MKNRKYRHIMTAALPFALALFACASGVKNSLEIRTNGFISDNCYQAILEIEPDEDAMGLVEGRESSYVKGKNADLRDLTAKNLAQYCLEARSAAGQGPRGSLTQEEISVLESKTEKLAGGGRIAFVYYNEKHSMIIGYRIFKTGLKKKLEAIINPDGASASTDSTTSRR